MTDEDVDDESWFPRPSSLCACFIDTQDDQTAEPEHPGKNRAPSLNDNVTILPY